MDSTSSNNDCIHGFPTLLPIGVRTPSGTVREFQLVKLGGLTEKILTNDNLRSNHAQKWLAMLVASVLDTIGETPVYPAFKKLEFREPPDSVKGITLQDASYILALAHMKEYGVELKEVTQPCPICKRRDKYTVDLSKMEILNVDTPTDPIVADLRDGFYKEVVKEKQLDYQGKLWNRYLLRPPVLRDAITYEKLCTQTNLLGFHMKLVAASLVGVEAFEGYGDQRIKVAEMDPAQCQMLASSMSLFEDLGTSDRMLLRRAVNDVPRIDLSVKQTCNNCGNDVDISVDIAHFFPLS